MSANLEREESSLEACGGIGTIGVTLGAHPTPIGIGSTSEASPLGFFKLFLASAHTIFRSRTQIGDQLLIERYECSYLPGVLNVIANNNSRDSQEKCSHQMGEE